MIARIRRWWDRQGRLYQTITPYQAFLMANNMDYMERRRHGL